MSIIVPLSVFLFHFRKHGVVVYLLHVVVIVKAVDHALYLIRKLGIARIHSGLRYHGYLGGKEAVAKLFKLLAHG